MTINIKLVIYNSLIILIKQLEIITDYMVDIEMTNFDAVNENGNSKNP